MDPIIIVAFCALAAVLAVVLICEAVRLFGAFRALRRAREEADSQPLNEVICVRQGMEEVRVAFRAQAKGVPQTAVMFGAAPAQAAKPEPAAKPKKDAAPEQAAKPQKDAAPERAAKPQIDAAPEQAAAPEETAAAQAPRGDRERQFVAAQDAARPLEEGESVFVPRGEKLTFAEKYERLDADPKALLDEFAAYITGLEDCSKLLQTSALAFRYRKGQIAKAVIRRGSVFLHFSIANPSLNRMVRSERIKGVRVRPIELRLSSREDLDFAKQTAEMTVGYLKGEEDYRSEKRKEARREAARQRREAANANTASEVTDDE